jgi:predicted MPP superfamily phosphohydrolase
LEKVLDELGVHIITNKAIEFNGITILGLGSLWARDDKIQLLDNYIKEDNLVVLTHNPDTTLDYMPNHYPDLTLAGHTHGGQVRIPYLYKKIIPVRGDVPWDQGLYTFEDEKVFVTSGIGEIGLPLRFLIPPTIDILELY